MAKSTKNMICPYCSQTNHKWSKVYYAKGAILKQAKGICIAYCSKTKCYCVINEKGIPFKFTNNGYKPMQAIR